MNPVILPTMLFEYMFWSSVALVVGIGGIFICMILLDIFDTRKKD